MTVLFWVYDHRYDGKDDRYYEVDTLIEEEAIRLTKEKFPHGWGYRVITISNYQ